MLKTEVIVDNLKCNGCASTISKKLSLLDGVKAVNVTVEDAKVEVSYLDHTNEEEIKNTLANLGYPEKGTSNTFQKAKSYVSCAIGKVAV